MITSNSETSHELVEDMGTFAPLPPPRPKHWARKVRQQNMTDQTTSESDKNIKEDTKDDWFSADSKFPIPMFKPTLSGMYSCFTKVVKIIQFGWNCKLQLMVVQL